MEITIKLSDAPDGTCKVSVTGIHPDGLDGSEAFALFGVMMTAMEASGPAEGRVTAFREDGTQVMDKELHWE